MTDTAAADEMAGSHQHAVPQRPRDSATLILLRRTTGQPVRILMGKRHQRHSFMPDKYVFPGGRRDASDSRMPVYAGLRAMDETRLMMRLRPKAPATLARALALTAIRETFEETGLIFGQKTATNSNLRVPGGIWQAFAERGYLPDLSGLCFFARAITPPGRTRRFDSRFFVADAGGIANPDNPVQIAEAELLDLAWVTFSEALDLDLPLITRDILARLETALAVAGGGLPGPEFVPDFQHMRGKTWVCEALTP